VDGVEVLGHLDPDLTGEVLQDLDDALERLPHRLGETLDLLEDALSLAADEPGHGAMDRLTAGDLRFDRDAGGPERQGPLHRPQTVLEVDLRALDTVMEQPSGVAGELFFQAGGVSAGTLALLHPRSQLGHQGVDVRLLLGVSCHPAGS
jgi:hypothetical protein